MFGVHQDILEKWINFNYNYFFKNNLKVDKRILFLLPHWSFKVDINKTFDLIKALITKIS